MVWPLGAARYAPIEDLPQHLAAIRVLHSYGDASFALQPYFELALRQTQYLAYYLLADGLAYLIDLELANRLLVVASVAAIPYALAYLLGALGRDRVLALFALPLTYNAHLILGFINFLMAMPAMLIGLGLCAEQCRAATRGRGIALGLVATFCFFCHVVPFAFLLLGAVLLCVQRSLRQTAVLLAPLAPALLIGAAWMAQSPAGQATLSAAKGGDAAASAQYRPADLALRDLPNWLTDVFQGPEGMKLLEYFALLLAATLLVGVGRSIYLLAARKGDVALGAGSFVRLAPLAPLAAAGYFVLPSGYTWIWPIAERFPLLALLLLVPVLPRPPRIALIAVVVALLGLAALQQQQARRAFVAFEQEEVGAFDQALAAIPQGQRVLGLIFARGSKHVKFSPFIHFVAYYQARKGGAVMFTFADFPQSPFRFREDNRPERVPPRWEWMPQRVRAADIRWYDYVLVRGGGDPCRGACELRFRQGFWSVWKRRA
jgi:hypothetical protein